VSSTRNVTSGVESLPATGAESLTTNHQMSLSVIYSTRWDKMADPISPYVRIPTHYTTGGRWHFPLKASHIQLSHHRTQFTASETSPLLSMKSVRCKKTLSSHNICCAAISQHHMRHTTMLSMRTCSIVA
jgi:hypothetical protein